MVLLDLLVLNYILRGEFDFILGPDKQNRSIHYMDLLAKTQWN